MIPIAASMPLITAEGIKCVKPPKRKMPSSICKSPAMETARKNISKDPSSCIAAMLIAVRPAAGPLTLNSEPLIKEITRPPIIPAKSPEYSGASDANEMPRQSGRATKKTVTLALRSCFRKERK